ncbi:protein of unknown function [Oenococcus oeni]|nr:hypothetical protein OENI_10286 [Oenococcus oeni]VDC14657.1 protein of unknown function [Oenococcus oeni]
MIVTTKIRSSRLNYLYEQLLRKPKPDLILKFLTTIQFTELSIEETNCLRTFASI